MRISDWSSDVCSSDLALDDTITLTPTPGHSPCHCCVNIHSKGQRAVVTGDMMHHAIQCREPDWSVKPDWDPAEGARSRRRFLSSVAGTERKSVGSGKGVSVRVDLGGRRTIKKK